MPQPPPSLRAGTRVARQRTFWPILRDEKEQTVDTTSPAAKSIETKLRSRYNEIWSDIRRELDKHEEQKY